MCINPKRKAHCISVFIKNGNKRGQMVMPETIDISFITSGQMLKLFDEEEVERSSHGTKQGQSFAHGRYICMYIIQRHHYKFLDSGLFSGYPPLQQPPTALRYIRAH